MIAFDRFPGLGVEDGQLPRWADQAKAPHEEQRDAQLALLAELYDSSDTALSN